MRLRVHMPERTSEWESDVALFRVGRADSCALRFEGEAAKYASWEHAEFSVDEGGAYVADLNSGNGTYLRGVRISQLTPLRVGDLVQIGTKGPKLEVLELGPVAPRSISPTNELTPRRPPPPPSRIVATEAANPSAPQAAALRARSIPCPHCSKSVSIPVEQMGLRLICSHCRRTFTATRAAMPRSKSAFAVVPAIQYAAPKKLPQQRLLIGAAVVVIAAVAVLLLRAKWVAPDLKPQQIVGAPTVKDNIDQPKGAPEKAADEPVKPENAPPAEQDLTIERPEEMDHGPARSPPGAANAFAAYRLIVIENPESEDPEFPTTLPFSGAIAVADHTLLTTAETASALADIMSKGWPVKAIRPSDGDSAAIRKLRVHAIFQESDPDEQIYFNVALLDTDEPLADVVDLATDDDLERLQRARPLTCIAADHDQIPFKGRWELPPTAHRGIILEPRYAQKKPHTGGVPGALVLRGRFHKWYFGSPIVNENGRLVALYCGPAAGDVKDKHFAVVVDADFIQIGLSEPDGAIWIPVTTPAKESDG